MHWGGNEAGVLQDMHHRGSAAGLLFLFTTEVITGVLHNGLELVLAARAVRVL